MVHVASWLNSISTKLEWLTKLKNSKKYDFSCALIGALKQKHGNTEAMSDVALAFQLENKMSKFTRCVIYSLCPYLVVSFFLLIYKFLDGGSSTGRYPVDRVPIPSIYRILSVGRNDDNRIDVGQDHRQTQFGDFVGKKLQSFLRNKISASDLLERKGQKKIFDLHLNESASEQIFNYEIHYQNFNITEPNFLSDEDRKQFLALSENVECLGPQPPEKLVGIIQVIPNGIANMDIDCGWPSKLEEFYSQDVKATVDILIPLLIPDSAAFQHFLDGTMPKIVQSYNLITAPNVNLLIFPPRDNIIFEMLHKLNISTDKVVYYTDTIGAKLQINSCITPPIHPMLWRKSRSMLGAPGRLPVSVSQSNVVLLTRAGNYNGGRRMLNFDEVTYFLQQRYSSRLVIFQGDYNLERSIQIFGESSILIGVHGGAMYNLNFASSDAHIVEFLPMVEYGIPVGSIAHTIVWHMSQLLGQTYWRIHQTADSFDGDINVPIDKLQALLNLIDENIKCLSHEHWVILFNISLQITVFTTFFFIS